MTNATTSSGSSSPTASPLPKPNDVSRLRKNLMYKLGVVDGGRSGIEKNQMLRKRDPSSSVSILGNVKHIKEPLKSRNDEEDQNREDIERREQWPMIWGGLGAMFNSSCNNNKDNRMEPPHLVQLGSSASTVDSTAISLSSRSCGSLVDGNEMKKQRRLSFNEEVSVCPIPKRDEYSNRIRQHLWHSATDMVKNAERNALEFASEGYDWKNVIECDEMYRDMKTNELIHPVHVECHFQQQEQTHN